MDSALHYLSSGWEKRAEASMDVPLISERGQSIVMWIGVALSFVFIVIRTYVQYQKSKKLFLNDHFIFLAMFCHLATAIVYQIAIPPMYEVAYIGARLKAPTEGFMDRASVFLKLQYAADILLWTALWAVKFSLLFFFWRLFDSVNSSMRIFWWIMCGITASTWIISVVMQEFACDPISNYFILGACTSKRDLYISNLIFRFSIGADIAGDLCVMVIPFPLLYKLNVDPRKRWILVGLFSLPIIPIIFAILRLVMTNPKSHNVDPIKFQLFSLLENTAAIVTSCLPAFRLFIANAHNSTVHSDSRPSRYSRGLRGAYKNFGASSSNKQETGIPFESLNYASHDTHIIHDGSLVGKALSKDSDEESLNPYHPTPPHGVLVTQEYRVT
ncbi:uncharacterized protein N7479_007165 [Penicillium vulpinum]|uniref:Rhodopsin domain-containing protein n=1 Tax=Penicillium vulpinum TaxID=29845 RepID=A0A1V6S1F7_9EURO|nr:uncharacterized protein N7479_007165 [Penicillium vulpinum]KAJ5960015.1 hypothetical protein N7479_007165 [Penicillium vulpinum]OQE07579.1 hypothetical protein PENVUL_c013G05830 [Penicillium vulpinum]